MNEVSKEYYDLIRDNPLVVQHHSLKPYFTRYFRDEPIFNPASHMTGQRVYRDFIFEDVYRFDCSIQGSLLKEDHSYSRIVPTLNKEHELI